MIRRIALFGGSFDPIHHGHLIIARALADLVPLEKVVFLPTASPPHKVGESLAAPAHRAAMVQLAIRNELRFELSDVDLTRDGPSFTIDTVEHFRRELGPPVRLYWIIGADSLNELPTWRRVGELVGQCRILTAARPGTDAIEWNALRAVLTEGQINKLRKGVVETPRVEISSTDVRRRVRRNQSIRHLVPESVDAYIQEHALYRTDA